jgi:hypothetical protein
MERGSYDLIKSSNAIPELVADEVCEGRFHAKENVKAACPEWNL